MKINEKFRVLRELNGWSQEDMAEKMQMSKNGYSKIERGESKVSLRRVEQAAQIFGVDVSELIASDKGIICFIGENNGHNANYYGSTEVLSSEVERLKLIISHKDEMLLQKEKEISILRDLVDSLRE